jgi:hypothetical protein
MATAEPKRIAEIMLFDPVDSYRTKTYMPEWAEFPEDLAPGVQVHFDNGRGYPSALRVMTSSGWRYLEPKKDGRSKTPVFELGGYNRDLGFLVLLAFLGPPPRLGGRTAACRVKNDGDCCIENLYWGSPITGACSLF